MPRIPSPQQLVKDPTPSKHPHLAIVTKGKADELNLMELPVGGLMAIVIDAKDIQRGIHIIAIERVGLKRLEFVCGCGQKNCTRKVVFDGTWSGFHPPTGGGVSKPT